MIPFIPCPECGRTARASLPPDWSSLVDGGAAIPIVGCGNPWHYVEDLSQVRPVEPERRGASSWLWLLATGTFIGGVLALAWWVTRQ